MSNNGVIWLGIASDLFVNLAAGWIGAIFAEITIVGFQFTTQIVRLFCVIICLKTAQQFRMEVNKYESDNCIG